MTDVPRSDLPPKPEPPLDSDCCGNGCEMCVYTCYELELQHWRDAVRAASAAEAATDAARHP